MAKGSSGFAEATRIVEVAGEYRCSVA
jgi:hypothetical protein